MKIVYYVTMDLTEHAWTCGTSNQSKRLKLCFNDNLSNKFTSVHMGTFQSIDDNDDVFCVCFSSSMLLQRVTMLSTIIHRLI